MQQMTPINEPLVFLSVSIRMVHASSQSPVHHPAKNYHNLLVNSCDYNTTSEIIWPLSKGGYYYARVATEPL